MRCISRKKLLVQIEGLTLRGETEYKVIQLLWDRSRFHLPKESKIRIWGVGVIHSDFAVELLFSSEAHAPITWNVFIPDERLDEAESRF